MTTNEDMALQVPARLSNENIEAISNYLPYRAYMRKSWSVKEAPERKEYVNTKHFTQSHLNQQENMIQKMMSKMRCNSASPGGVIFYVSVPQKKLIQPFTAAEATKQVEKGMLDGLTLGRTTFYNIKEGGMGQMEENMYIQTREKIRKVKYEARKRKTRYNTVFETRTVSDCFRVIFSPKRIIDQAITFTIPLCLANEDNSPYNSGDKSQVMKLFEDSYPHAFSDRLEFSPGWIIIELMMLIHVAPRSTHKTFGDWGESQWSIYISPWLAIAGSTVCLLGDHPKKDIKSLERLRRGEIDEDQTINIAINSDTPGNERWESVLASAGNKRAICEFLGQFFLEKGRFIPPDKRLLVSGCFGREMLIAVFRLIVKMSIH